MQVPVKSLLTYSILDILEKNVNFDSTHSANDMYIFVQIVSC